MAALKAMAFGTCLAAVAILLGDDSFIEKI